MCTAVSLVSKAKEVYLGRTMDFSHELNPEVYIVPKNYEWESIASKHRIKNQYQFIGTGQNIGKVVFADGMNEYGLGVAVLYFPGYALFDSTIDPKRESIASLELVQYLLGSCRTTEDVIRKLPSLQLVGIEDPVTNSIAPLHWIVADKKGSVITLEKTQNGMEVLENPIGVLANSPNFSWHLTNLRNYMNVTPEQRESQSWNDTLLTPFGQGAGTFGLPGDYTSPSRFVRVSYQKSFIDLPESREEMLLNCFHLMQTVSIPKGIVKTKTNASDYTQYIVFMNLSTGDYFFNTYLNPTIKTANLRDGNSTQIISLGPLKVTHDICSISKM